MKIYIDKVISFFLVILTMMACNSAGDQTLKKTCLDIEVLRNGKFVTVDSCFTATSRDSLDKIIAAFRLKQSELVQYETKLLFIIVDTLQKKPDEYEYALVVSDAGIINPDVILTNDVSVVKERSAPFSQGNIILKKLIVGESIKGSVEIIFKTNIRINYRRESNTKVIK